MLGGGKAFKPQERHENDGAPASPLAGRATGGKPALVRGLAPSVLLIGPFTHVVCTDTAPAPWSRQSREPWQRHQGEEREWRRWESCMSAPERGRAQQQGNRQAGRGSSQRPLASVVIHSECFSGAF